MWTTYYDSIYAMQDREFDKKLGLNSTAILIENNPKLALGALAAGTVGMFAAGGAAAGFGMYYKYGLGVLAT
jgi:4-hydroxybenzoate polyprenyltransferase